MIIARLFLPWLMAAAQAAAPPAPSAAPTAATPANPAPAAATPTPAATPVADQAPADADQRMDQGLELLKQHETEKGAATLYALYAALPETDLRRDQAAFRLAGALVELGFVQAGIEYYLEVLGGRRSPELLGKSLAALKPLYEKNLVEEWRFVRGTIYGMQYGDLDTDVADFVEYLQALMDLRLGFGPWGRARLETLAATERIYGWRARYLLAVDRIEKKNDEGAEKLLRQILDAPKAPDPVRTVSALALARILYERKDFENAYAYYQQAKLPLVEQDLVLLELAWDRIGSEDHQRALGMVTGLGAPIFRRVFAPERDLMRALSLRRLCQFGLAHKVVREFRDRYGALVKKARDREGLSEDKQIVEWAAWGTRLSGFARMRTRLRTETALLDRLSDEGLGKHLSGMYAARRSFTDDKLRRGLKPAILRVVDELLRVDEQMNLIDYEIGAGLVKPGTKRGESQALVRPDAVPYGSPKVYYPFDGEYWSDELNDFAVLADDRCLR
jgi:tetratricopeptide (TPR) repeat protein